MSDDHASPPQAHATSLQTHIDTLEFLSSYLKETLISNSELQSDHLKLRNEHGALEATYTDLCRSAEIDGQEQPSSQSQHTSSASLRRSRIVEVFELSRRIVELQKQLANQSEVVEVAGRLVDAMSGGYGEFQEALGGVKIAVGRLRKRQGFRPSA